MNINEHYSNILKIISSSKRFENIKSGDIVKYSVMRHIENNKFLINIMGKKTVAEIKGGNVKENSFAKVIGVVGDGENKKLILSVVQNEDTLVLSKYKSDNTAKVSNVLNDFVKESDKMFVKMLNEKGIKADFKNIDYIKTVLKYMPNLETPQKALVFSFISKGIYLNVYELTSVFEGKLFSYFKNNIKNTNFNDIKKANINTAFAEKLREAMYKLFTVNSSQEIKDLIDNNGYFNLLFMIFDSIHGSDVESDFEKELKDFVNIFLRLLSNNRKNNSLKEDVYFLPIAFVFENELKQVNIFINKERDNGKLNIIFKDASEEENSLFEIIVRKPKERENSYKIDTYFFDEELYKKFEESKEMVLNNIKDICLKENVIIDTEVFYNKDFFKN